MEIRSRNYERICGNLQNVTYLWLTVLHYVKEVLCAICYLFLFYFLASLMTFFFTGVQAIYQ